MSPSFSTRRASTPVSSRTSRRAASAADSRPSGWPFGRARTVLPSAARRGGTISMHSPSRPPAPPTAPPAENSDSAPVGISAPLEDVALERLGIVHDDPSAALRDDGG